MNKFVLFFYTLIFAVTGLFASSHVDIFQAIKQGDIKTVKRWIKSKPDLLIFNDQGQTVLHAAVMTGDWSMVKAVLRSKIAINILDAQGKTALDYAVDEYDEKIVRKLARCKAQATTERAAEYVANVKKFDFPRAAKWGIVVAVGAFAAAIGAFVGVFCMIASACH